MGRFTKCLNSKKVLQSCVLRNMVDLKKVGAGTVAFFVGYIFVLMTEHIVVPVITTLEELGISTTLSGIVWFGIIILWVLAMLVIPVGLMIYGVMQSTENDKNAVKGLTTGVLWFILAGAFIYFTYYMMTPLSQQLTYPMLTVLFWVGLIIIWIVNIAVVPAYYIIEAKRG